MKKIKRAAAILLASVMLLSALSGCGEEEKTGFSLRIAAQERPDTLDPAMADSDTEKTVVVHLFENLMKLTESGVVCAQAKSYECTDNLDGTETYTFQLRTDSKWSDGRTVTAQDFVYAWQRLVDPNTASPNASLLDMVSGYEAAAAGDVESLQVWAEDDATLVVVLNCHCPYFLSSICTAAATMPVRADVVDLPHWSMDRNALLTNGAYRVATWGRDNLLLEETEDYYDTKRILATQLEFRFGLTEEDAMTQYENGELDIVLAAQKTEQSQISYQPAVKVLLLNQMSPLLRKEELCQAMNLCLDRNTLVQELGERYLAADGLVPYGTRSTQEGDFRDLGGAAVDNDPEDYEANCAAAQEKLASIGYSGTPIGTVTMLYEAGPGQQQVVQMLQNTWQDQLHLQVEAKCVTAEGMQEALSSGEFTVALTSITSDRNDAVGYLDRFGSGHSENYGMYYSNAYDMLMRAAAASQSAEARDAYLADAERLLLESGSVIPLYNTFHYWLVRENLTGAFDNGQDAHYFAYVREVQS